MAAVRTLQQSSSTYKAPPNLLSLPDEIFELIGQLLESDESCHCKEGHDLTNFKSYIRVCKRIYRAALSVGWKAWELSSESYERLLQHKDHLNVIRCVRHLYVPWCDNRSLGSISLQTAPVIQLLENEAGIPFYLQMQGGLEEPPAEDDEGQGQQDASDQESQLESTPQYDQTLSECVGLFERLESLIVTFCDWTMSDQHALNVPTTLLHARLQPLLRSTMLSSMSHLKTITRLSFSGVRSPEDQANVVACIAEQPYLHANLKSLSVIYRFDFLLFSANSLPVVPPLDSSVDSKPLWTAIGKLEKLESLTIVNLPQKYSEIDMIWRPEVFKPKLNTICLEEVALSPSVVRTLLKNSSGLKTLVASSHCITGIRELEATSEQPVTFPQLSTLELFVRRGADAFDALALFTHAPVTHLTITMSEPLPFLQQYPEHKAKQRTVEVLTLHEIYGEEEETQLSEAQEEAWIQTYRDLGIKLCFE